MLLFLFHVIESIYSSLCVFHPLFTITIYYQPVKVTDTPWEEPKGPNFPKIFGQSFPKNFSHAGTLTYSVSYHN